MRGHVVCWRHRLAALNAGYFKPHNIVDSPEQRAAQRGIRAGDDVVFGTCNGRCIFCGVATWGCEILIG